MPGLVGRLIEMIEAGTLFALSRVNSPTDAEEFNRAIAEAQERFYENRITEMIFGNHYPWAVVTSCDPSTGTDRYQARTYRCDVNLGEISNLTFEHNSIYEPSETTLAELRSYTYTPNRRRFADEGLEVLRKNLSVSQLEQFDLGEEFTVTCRSGNEYLITKSSIYNVYLINGGRKAMKYCCGPDRSQPVFDVMLTQKLWLETDEMAFLEQANQELVYDLRYSFHPVDLGHRFFVLSSDHHYVRNWCQRSDIHPGRAVLLRREDQLFEYIRPFIVLMNGAIRHDRHLFMAGLYIDATFLDEYLCNVTEQVRGHFQ